MDRCTSNFGSNPLTGEIAELDFAAAEAPAKMNIAVALVATRGAGSLMAVVNTMPGTRRCTLQLLAAVAEQTVAAAAPLAVRVLPG